MTTFRQEQLSAQRIEHWRKVKAEAVPYRDRIMKSINRLRFKTRLWKMGKEEGVSRNEIYNFVNKVRKLSERDSMTFEYFNEGMRFRFIFQDVYKYALEDFWLLCWGDW